MATIADQMKKMGQQVFPSATAASSSGGMIPQMKAMPAAAPPPKYDDSSASNLAKITAAGSPVMTQAANAGLATANRRGLLNSSIAVGAAQGEVLKVATPLATADAGINAQKNLSDMASDSAIRQIQEQGKVTGGLQQQQQAATSALSTQEAAQLSALEKQRAAATTEQQRADIQAQMDRLTQSQTGTSALSAQESAQLSALERQRAAATSDQQRTDIDAQMARLRESGSQQLSQLGAASGYEQQRIVLQGQINALAAGTAAADQRSLVVLQGGIQSALQSQTDASTMQRLSAQYAQETKTQDRATQADLQKIAASGDQNVRQALVTAESAREQLAMQLASGDREKAATLAVQVFSAEAAIRQSLLANTAMPAAERAAYEKAISSLGDPMRNFLNNLYSKPAGSGGLIA
jgi:hypothetical protein